MNPSHEDLIRRIVEKEARLTSLERQRQEAREEVEALRDQLEELAPSIAADAADDIGAAAPPTSAEKVRRFRSLFRGRADVFPTRFVSKKTGKSGYAPACANKFVRGECPNQAFQTVDDLTILNHLKGHHVMGVDPLLGDETCWFTDSDRILRGSRTPRWATVRVEHQPDTGGEGGHVTLGLRLTARPRPLRAAANPSVFASHPSRSSVCEGYLSAPIADRRRARNLGACRSRSEAHWQQTS